MYRGCQTITRELVTSSNFSAFRTTLIKWSQVTRVSTFVGDPLTPPTCVWFEVLVDTAQGAPCTVDWEVQGRGDSRLYVRNENSCMPYLQHYRLLFYPCTRTSQFTNTFVYSDANVERRANIYLLRNNFIWKFQKYCIQPNISIKESATAWNNFSYLPFVNHLHLKLY